jgi:hypothetical protein
MSFDPMWPLIVLIAMLLMGPLLMVVAFLNMTDSLIAATSAIVLSFIAAWAVCVFASRYTRGIGSKRS